MSQPDDVDKMVSDFLLELQTLSDSLQVSDENAAPDTDAEEPVAEPPVAEPREVLPVTAHNPAPAQPAPSPEGVSAKHPATGDRDIRLILSDNSRLPLEATEPVDKPSRPLRWAAVLFASLCLIGVLFALDPFRLTSRWNPPVPPAPSGASTADPSPVRPAVPVEKIVPALPTPPAPSSSSRSQPAAAPAARATPAVRTIGVSYRTVTAQLGKFFSMKKATRPDGQPAFRGQTNDRMATLVIIGNEDNVSEACLTAGLPANDRGAAERNGGFAFSFIQNIEPDWADAPNWITENLVNISKSETEYVEIVRGERRIRLRWVKATGTMSVSVRHKGQEEPETGNDE